MRRRGPSRAASGRVAVYLFMVWVVITLVFAVPRAMPGDPLSSFEDGESALSPEARTALAAHYHLDRPLLEQYGRYLTSLARADLGESIGGQGPVAEQLQRRLPWTLLLAGTALALSSTVGFLTGVTSAWRRESRTDRELLAVMTVVRAVPEYMTASVLLILFGVVIQVFPIAGSTTPFPTSSGLLYTVGDVAYHLVLPAVALALGLMGTTFLLVRNTTVSILGQDYMVAARAKGVPVRLLKYRHAGRNAMLPFLTLVGVQTGFATGGALFVETVFAYPGLASLLVPAVNRLDYPLLEGCFLVLAFVVLTVNLVIDLAYGRLDPRVG